MADEINQSVLKKIQSIEELAKRTRDAQDAGKTVVLCHGVFDLVHMGHIRHFDIARKEGDLLIVTTTADAFVNKGPGRPIFTDQLRAEMLAALQMVDWVGINYGPTAEYVLDTIRPDVYVKGSDYENPEEDVTGMILRERDVVEKHGGKVVFTRDINFSSSELINKYLGVYDAPLQNYLDRLRGTDTAQKIEDLIEKVRDFKVLIVGDAIIDEYLYVEAMGKSAKESMIATRYQNSELFAGGVFAAANHVASLCAEVEIITTLGNLDSHEKFIRRNLKPNVKLTPVHRDGIPTTKKSRIVERGYNRKLFEIYYFDDTPAQPEIQQVIDDLIAERAPAFDLVIVTDFGHGLITSSTIEALQYGARFLAVNTQTNSANIGYNLITRYSKADYICIDAPEAQLATSDRRSNVETLVSQIIPKRVQCPRITVTHGKMGCVAYQAKKPPVRVPAFTKTVVDTVGAGDAFLAITSPLAAAGGDYEHIGFVGNAAGAIKVGTLGHRAPIEKVPLMRFITTLLK